MRQALISLSHKAALWDPAFSFTEVRLADLDGYQRRFAVKIEVATESPEHPGLVLSLERQPGLCRGLAFRIATDLVEAKSELLWRREMLLFGYAPTTVPLATPQGDVTGVAFASDRSDPKYVGELPLGETAAIIADGRGPRGDNRDHIAKLAEALGHLGIEDSYVTRLRHEVDRAARGRT